MISIIDDTDISKDLDKDQLIYKILALHATGPGNRHSCIFAAEFYRNYPGGQVNDYVWTTDTLPKDATRLSGWILKVTSGDDKTTFSYLVTLRSMLAIADLEQPTHITNNILMDSLIGQFKYTQIYVQEEYLPRVTDVNKKPTKPENRKLFQL